MTDKSNCVESPKNQSHISENTETQMVEHPHNEEFCDPGGEKDLGLIDIKELHALGKKSIEHEDDCDDDDDSEEPEIIIDTIVNPLEVQDDSSSDTSLRAVKLTRSAANDSMLKECMNESNNISKPTEFVIVSTISGSTVKFPDDVQIKDELAEPIATSCSPNDEEALENDPMGLLEINDRCDVNSSRSNAEQDDGGDDISSTCSSSVQTTTSTVNISDWAKDYPWLLHEECDEWYGYCLYCDVKLSVRSYKSAKHHDISLYHRERCEHYLAFREEEEKNNLGTSVSEIKQEFGTDSYVAALKLKRKTQAEAFNNYNWRRWLDECPWLERDSLAGTIGLCKYCSVRLNVEFSYLRQRHQEGTHHKERAKMFTKMNESKKSDEVNEVNGEDEEEEATNDNADHQEDADGDDDGQQISKTDETWCFEQVDDTTARCTLCDTELKKRSSFKRHLQTQVHLHNEKNQSLVEKVKSRKSGKLSAMQGGNDSNLSKTPTNNWDMYAKLHSWLTVDPEDDLYAYCKYCNKRLNYGTSAAKRATHENSYSHKANEKAYKESQEKDDNQPAQANEEDGSAIDGGDEDGDDDDEEEEAEGDDAGNDEEEENESDQDEEDNDEEDGEEEQEDDGDEEDANSEEEEEEDDVNEQDTNADEEEPAKGDTNKSKKQVLPKNSDNPFPWCKKFKKDPKYIFCSYCKISITKNNRKKHSYSKKHVEAEEKVLRRKNRTEAKRNAKEEDLFEWAVNIKAQPHLYYCKCCRVRISKHYSKKQHSVSKIHQINEKIYQNRKKTINLEAVTKASQLTTSSAQSSQQRNPTPPVRKVVVKGTSFISSIKQWQKRHTWLGYKLSELRSNYAYCKACDQSLYVRSFKNVIKHQRSSKHLRIVNQLKRDRQKDNTNNSIPIDKKITKREVDQVTSPTAADTSVQRENSDELNNSAKDPPKGSNYKSTIESMQKRFSWIIKATKPEYAYCRYCDVDVPLKILFLRNHTNSGAHRRSVVNFGGEKTKTEKSQNDESNATDNEAEEENDEADDDVVLLEDNTEEILISEQDDNWTVKSENMDEHEALDCLLQRVGKSVQASNNANSSRDDRKQPATTDDRPSKRFKRSHSFRRLNDSTNSSLISSILSTPLTLASCLGPLIQQQIQQVTNSQQSSASTTISPTASQPPPPQSKEPENTYDLFFKSVSETMKKLPVDIAAEGKVKVMQIICDLELRALKRQQEQHRTMAGGQSMEQLNNTNLSSNSNLMDNSPTADNRTNSNVVTNSTLNLTNFGSNEQVTETNVNSSRIATENSSTTSASDQFMGETVITPIYGNINTSPNNRQPHPQNYQQTIQQKTQQTNVTNVSNNTQTTSSTFAANVALDKHKTSNQAPIIGVMDMNGLQTLQLRNNPIVKQIPKQNLPTNSGQSTSTTTSIRCIPFKNLTQNGSGDSNTKITRIQVPISATSTPTSQQSSQNNAASIANTPKGLLNLRSIHITKRTSTTPQQQQKPQMSSPVSVSVVNTISDKNQTPTYVQTSTMQRWATLNGSINTVANKKPPQQCTTTTANFQVSAKQQNFTPINRNYK